MYLHLFQTLQISYRRRTQSVDSTGIQLNFRTDEVVQYFKAFLKQKKNPVCHFYVPVMYKYLTSLNTLSG